MCVCMYVSRYVCMHVGIYVCMYLNIVKMFPTHTALLHQTSKNMYKYKERLHFANSLSVHTTQKQPVQIGLI